MAVPVPAIFLALAGVSLVGYWAGRLFQRTRIPDALPLLGLGLLIGPANRWAVERGFGWDALAEALNLSNLLAAAPIIAGLALVVLLFESGMSLEFGTFGRSLGPALVFTIPVYLLTVASVALVGHWVLGMPSIVAVVLGVALVNVDQTVSSGVIQGMRLDARTKATYFVEMALYDLISIPIFVSLLEFASGTAGDGGAAGFLRGFTSLLSVSLAAGFVVGIVWIFALRRLKGHPHSYMLTFAVMVGSYGLSELLGGSGALSTLVFGLLLGNRAQILKRFARLRDVDDEHTKVQAFHDEIAFFVRTVFFLFLGASFSLGLSGTWEATSRIPGLHLLDRTTALVVFGALLILVAIIVSRSLAVRLVTTRKRPDRRELFPVFGRGLDTAVLATVPFLATSYTSGEAYKALFDPWKPVFLNVSLLTVLFTIVTSGIAVFLYERRLGGRRLKAQEKPPERPAPERGPETAVPAKPRKPKNA